LKEKLGKALDKFSEKAEKEEKQDEKIEEPKKEDEEKPSFVEKIKQKVTSRTIDEKKFEDMFWSLEVALMENNVSVEVIDKIKEDLKMDLVNVPIKRGEVKNIVEKDLRKSINEVLTFEKIDLIKEIGKKNEKPFVIVFFGINGAGKTTTLAKIAHLLIGSGLTCVLAAGDTWRKAAIEQIQDWADKLDVKLIRGQYGSDPAAIGFDAVAYAKKNRVDVVLVDTAGRQHSNTNLMDELKKISRVVNPDFKIFVGESITGNDATNQAKEFDQSIGIDGIILTKYDSDEKGGAVISVSFVTGKPIIYLGKGQKASDLVPFEKDEILESILK